VRQRDAPNPNHSRAWRNSRAAHLRVHRMWNRIFGNLGNARVARKRWRLRWPSDNIESDPPRIVLGEQVGRRSPPRLILEIDIRKRLPIVIADDGAGVQFTQRTKAARSGVLSLCGTPGQSGPRHACHSGLACHRAIQHTARYTELSQERFKDF
jgi:hypothetical protein